MAKKQTASAQTKDEAMKIARSTQRPGQTKEQTRLIAQGIQKGIDQYKKQQKSKARELDKKLKQASRKIVNTSVPEEAEVQQPIQYRQHWFPWLLLGVSWIGFVGFFLL